MGFTFKYKIMNKGQLEKGNAELQRKLVAVEDELREHKKVSVGWSVWDFESQAKEMEDPDAYDPEKYQAALERMVYKHDACNGITWDTIEYYLDDQCKKD